MKSFGLIAAFGSLVAAMAMSSDVVLFLNAPSAIIVFAVGLGATLFAHGTRGLGLLMQAVGGDVETEDAQEAADTALSASKAFIGAGVLGFIVGVVAMLANLDDPSAIGPAVAVALLTVLYGCAMSTILWTPTERRMRTLAQKQVRA